MEQNFTRKKGQRGWKLFPISAISRLYRFIDSIKTFLLRFIFPYLLRFSESHCNFEVPFMLQINVYVDNLCMRREAVNSSINFECRLSIDLMNKSNFVGFIGNGKLNWLSWIANSNESFNWFNYRLILFELWYFVGNYMLLSFSRPKSRNLQFKLFIAILWWFIDQEFSVVVSQQNQF